MNFALYLTEAQDEKISVDDFIKSIKEKGLYGYDVMKNFKSEDELREKLVDDNYFNSKEKKSDPHKNDEVNDDDKKITEMVIRNNGNTTNNQPNTQNSKLSLAVRLGLKQQVDQTNTQDQNNQTPMQQHVFGTNTQNQNNQQTQDQNQTQQKPVQQSFADKMRAFADQKKREQQELADKEKELRDQRAKEAEQRSDTNTFNSEPTTFNGVSKDKQDAQDNKLVNKSLADIEKELNDEMFKKTRAATKVNDQGYKSVSNFSRVSDAKAEQNLAKEMSKKFPSKDATSNQKLGNSNQTVEKEEHIMSRNEYSKRTLLALAAKIPDFSIYCKYRKLNGDIRTGQFTLLGAESQVTNKQDTLVVIDQDLSKKENKKVYRTINLFKILEIKPL